MGMIVDNLPPRTQSILDGITTFMGMIVISLAAWQNLVHARAAQLDNVTSSTLKIPAFPFYIVIGLGYALLFLVLIKLVIQHIRAMFK